jgi:hypothetical protein
MTRAADIPTGEIEQVGAPATAPATELPAADHASVDLGRIAWLVTSLACLIAAVIVLLQGYYGYAGVTFAVALAAAINLF